MKIKSHIPNIITLLNLLSGVIGIIWVINGNIFSGAYFIILAAIFDFFDGFAARLLNVQGELGKQLDSLADLVSFGVLPGMILFQMAKVNTDIEWLPYLTLIVPLLSAMRLAKFNLDTRQSDKFIGLPTPANALFICTLPYLAIQWPYIGTLITSPFILIGIAWIFAILLLVELPLIALKFKSYSFTTNKFRYAIIALSIALILIFGLAGIPIVILAYLGLSLVENVISPE
ncbi:CDP-diacylglycerol--serine O-phosphatidyltransferase [Algoriphagus ratkowskyi]|uniref:CDP-diacylglycerol--serine O-phosphatidyltransferase n=1 Tax=Algoriphagus ratkowskyi TaxID=57028 RepID=A0A2W7RGF7_9BACT|nr:CDP-diacylglycerol--serine O-phosphatidyltransferase [Algoriphagus ratkowskyi]PZX59251.1 CDP-diacylglycerol--serine O-phosphatidyltransferase [Algoriphagus ratkowskyi]TXD77473.1 CDP-diacylglycerol--serine O-phosphatidyltransferase [Algoriphagus ratkowskyi]